MGPPSRPDSQADPMPLQDPRRTGRVSVPTQYYRNVSSASFLAPIWKRFITPVVLSVLAFTGCDRGSHPGQLGQTAPDFIIHDGAQTMQLSAYRGRVVLLVFWATWCPPCVEELPSLMELQRQMPGIVVLNVDTDDDAAAYRQFLIDNQVNLLSIHDEQQTSNSRYGTHRFPESYLIDQQGIIRRKFIGPQDWASPEIRSYLGSLQGHDPQTL